MDQHGGRYRWETRLISTVERRCLCEVCPRTFKQPQHLRRHVRDQEDVSHRNYYSALTQESCKHCGGTFTKRSSLAQHNKAPCGRGEFHITLQSDFDTLGRRLKKSKRDESTSVSTQLLPPGLPTIPPEPCTFSDPEITAQLPKWSHEGQDGKAPALWSRPDWYHAVAPSWSQDGWLQEGWKKSQEEWEGGAPPPWPQVGWQELQVDLFGAVLP